MEDTETHFSQSTRSNVGVLCQKQTDTGGHKDTGARTTITAAGGSTTTATGGVVTQRATFIDKTWNEKKESMTPLGSALVGLVITGATFLSGGTAAGALGILNPMGASALNAGVASFGTQLALGTINNKGDIGKALEGISPKQVAVSMAAAGISAGVISAFTPGVVPRLDPNFRAGAGAGTSFNDMGLTQSASFAGTATQATSASTWASGFVSRLPAHGIQTLTNMGANAILSDGDVKAVRNAALGSLATIVGTEATLPLGQAYHAGQVNPFVHKVLHGGIGAGTAAISGGNVWAGAAGAVAGEVAGQVYLGTQNPTLQNTNHLIRQAANIGRIAGGLAGLVAGRDPNTGANTGTIASENNAVGTVLDAVQVAQDLAKIGKGYATGDEALIEEGWTDLALDAAATAIPGLPAGLQKIGRVAKEGAEAVTQKLTSGAAKEAGEKAVTKADDVKLLPKPEEQKLLSAPEAQGQNTQFVDGIKVTDQRTEKVFEGTVDLNPTFDRIASGKKLDFKNDGIVFQNREGILPSKPSGYYNEYVVETSGIRGPGPQRVITGKDGEVFYTSDHYKTFIQVKGKP